MPPFEAATPWLVAQLPPALHCCVKLKETPFSSLSFTSVETLAVALPFSEVWVTGPLLAAVGPSLPVLENEVADALPVSWAVSAAAWGLEAGSVSAEAEVPPSAVESPVVEDEVFAVEAAICSFIDSISVWTLPAISGGSVVAMFETTLSRTSPGVCNSVVSVVAPTASSDGELPPRA
jgi:hypothetical protein